MILGTGVNWDIGKKIGSGGFGQVYAASSLTTPNAVAKFIPKVPGAERELLFVDLAGIPNVVPIIDQGDDGDHWILIMPRAEKSLRQHLLNNSGLLSLPETLEVLSDIACALSDLNGKAVHRDLKPENVLLLNGRWCLADFGISRYAEAATAIDTQKYALSPQYAGPERWRVERASIATDVYSFGVIAFEMISGAQPFPGPSLPDFREQHLHSDPPPLLGSTTALNALVGECLYKGQAARPSPANLVLRLRKVLVTPIVNGLSRLQQANLVEVARQGEVIRQASESFSQADILRDLLRSAKSSFEALAKDLQSLLLESASAAKLKNSRNGGWTIEFGNAVLNLCAFTTTPEDPWNWTPPAFKVIAHSSIQAVIPRTSYGYSGRSHSLWFCDALEAGRYQWFETAFMSSPMVRSQSSERPFALEPGEDSAKALWTGMSEFQVAWPFMPLTIGDLDDFIGRWSGWLADGAQGRLGIPQTMPERSTSGTWRRT